MVKTTKQLPKKQKEWEVVVNDEYDDNDDYWGGYGGEQFVVQLKEKVSKEERIKRVNRDPWWMPEKRMIFGCELMQEESCCGFPQLGGFETGLDEIPAGQEEFVVKTFKNWMNKKDGNALKSKGYYSAYIPDIKQYDKVRKVFIAAGYIPGVRLKSNHGDYTNTRWEWFDAKKVECPIKDTYVENVMKKVAK